MKNKDLKMNNTDGPYILLFDGVCNLCSASVKFTIKRDHKKKFKFASLQSETGQIHLHKTGLPAAYADSIILISKDRYFIKSAAVLQVLKEIGGIWGIMYVFIYLPRPFRDFFYNLIAKTRYRFFGKKDSCMVPSIEVKDRFID